MASVNSLSTDWDGFYRMIGGGPTGTAGGKPLKKDPGYIPSLPTGVSRVTPEGLNVYSRPAVKIGPDGNPIGIPAAPSLRAGTQNEQRSGSWPAITVGTQPAGSVAMPQGARPSNIPLPGNNPPALPTAGTVHDPFRTINPNADQSRLPTDMGYMTGPAPGNQNPALDAIDQLTGSGRSTAFPMPLPFFRQPVVAPMTLGGVAPAGVGAAGGNPWAGLRIGAPPPAGPQGLTTGQGPAAPPVVPARRRPLSPDQMMKYQPNATGGYGSLPDSVTHDFKRQEAVRGADVKQAKRLGITVDQLLRRR